MFRVQSYTAPAIAALVATVAPASAVAAGSSGGAGVPDSPAITSISCVGTQAAPCAKNATLLHGRQARVAGSDLEATETVIFRGARGTGDDVAVKPVSATGSRVVLRVPAAARSGVVTLVSDFAKVSTQTRVTIADAPAAAPVDTAPGGRFFLGGKRKPVFSFDGTSDGPVQIQVVRESDGTVVKTIDATAVAGQRTDVAWDGLTDAGPAPNGQYRFSVAGQASAAAATSPAQAFALYDHVFPIRGKHNLGYTATNDFGGPRDHKGQDMFAACGTPVAAARGGRVEYAGYQSAAGNYVVIDGDSGQDYVYMHMRLPPLVRTGQKVFTGQQIGEVGETGRAQGCHLHFELWSAPGWYKGGAAFDPKPQLRAWDAYS